MDNQCPPAAGQEIVTAKKQPRWVAYLPMYLSGFSSLSLQRMIQFMIPLWALMLGASPLMIGIAAGAGSILPVLFSISSGTLNDRIGSRRLMLYGSLILVFLAVLHPMLPFIPAFILLQLLFGQVQSANWIAAQTYVARFGKRTNNNFHVGAFTFFVNAGNFAGPLLVGLMWDLSGPWGGFSAIACWCLILWCSAFALPEEARHKERTEPIGLGSLIPQWQDYRKAFALISIPLVFFVVYCTFLRIAGYAIQGSFYLVYLKELGFPAATISFIFSFLALTSIFSPLCMGFLARWIDDKKLLLLAVITGIFPLCLTPLAHGIWPLLGLAAVSGFGLGLTLPLLLSVMSGTVSPEEQGLAVGLRVTANRLSSAVVPFLFGLLVEGIGLHPSFYVIGAVLLLPMLFVVPYLYRRLNRSL